MFTNCNCFLFKDEFFVDLFKILSDNCAFCCTFCLELSVFTRFFLDFSAYFSIFTFIENQKNAPASGSVLCCLSAIFEL